ncbi:NAD(P)-dependent dehydrogenase (short-subunit alcohol dehydrogenase family) [Flavobacterium cauense R2A-7]|uniref:NAD(P)-dependent dehydrogenase (Short-subunit alcohol dehydrogenase family) n=1 Tax=Flavobacterium cauense R2A-7 TaxID=1341154 RepID=A0A562LW09_9FLAO|nr:SDR family oxidoreductase [Flavobacterium cauense]KGO80689.1 oxidoreductase [Flavobacterium cauense R2A-7]TWI11837.1 NAD(P)-dependent dehydrogenase (short-subunit alcohol dehydrogenase family) [Flavobacterium cauense R2A-7]
MKNILIIGGSYGIGLAIAKELQDNSNLFIASRSNAALADVKAMHISFDALTDSINTSLLPTTIDGLVYCPGSINLRPFKGLKPEAFESDLQLNFISLIKVIQSVLPNLLAAEQASIVLFSSVAAMMGMPFHTSVAASKGAIEGFAKALAAEYAPKIRVNVIAPSLTDTPLAEKFLNNETKQEKSAERHPLKRFGKPEDSAQMTSFLLSDKSSWITGQIFHVDGGMSTLLING